MKNFKVMPERKYFKIHLKVDANLVADTRAIPLNIVHRISKLMQNKEEWKE